VAPKVLSQTVRAIAAGDLPALLKIVGDLVEVGQDLTNFCRRLLGQFRNLMVVKAGIADPALLGIPESLLPDLREQAELFSREDLLRLFDGFQKIEMGMKYATQVRFQLEMGLIELAHIAKLRPLEDLVAEFSAMTGGGGLPPDKRPPGGKSPETGTGRPVSGPSSRSSPSAPVLPRPQPVPEAPKKTSSSQDNPSVRASDPRELLLRIAAAVGRESLESCLQNLAGARLVGEQITLEPGGAGEFVRRQVKDNIPLIAEAASGVLGSKVKVALEELEFRKMPAPAPRETGPLDEALLEKAKREPVVRSFLDVFPGPVKAEKIKS
jgi:DNA polymerase III gamma/tau subunit